MAFNKKKKLKIALLSTKKNPLLKRNIREILKKNTIEFIAYDKKQDPKAKMLWKQRTKNRVSEIKLKKKIKSYFFSNHNNSKLVNLVKKKKIDLLISCSSPRIIKQQLLNAPKIGILNCHPGLLPFYRGCNCVEWALYNKDKVGNTCHLMTKRIDQGPIICSRRINIQKSKDYYDVRIAVYLDSVKLISKAIEIIKKDNYNKKIIVGGKYWKVMDKFKLEKVINIMKK